LAAVESEGSRRPEFSFARELPLTRRAIAFAEEHHGSQRRAADGASFIVHPLEVASYLERAGYPDHVVAAAVLHDVLEDTDAKRAELESLFGHEVGELVAVVSDDPGTEDEERRKDEVRNRVRQAGGYAPVVYGVDKVSKVRELRMLVAQGLEPEEAMNKLRRYRKSLEMLDRTIPGSRVVELLRFEIEAFEKLPPERADWEQGG
jgi:guanosine-3',5'-bis(diphosphate) 3'-pyrophosphohydrolase